MNANASKPVQATAKPSRSRGIALVAVLWIVATLTVLVMSFNAAVRSHLDVAVSELSIARSEAVIEAALRLAVVKLGTPDQQKRWKADGRPYVVSIVGRKTRISVQDSKGLIDLNSAPAELLAGLFKKHSGQGDEARQLAARVIDWRDPDQEVSENGGAEDATYKAEGRKIGAGDTPFLDTIELANVLGVKAGTVTRLEPYVTVYGGGLSNKDQKEKKGGRPAETGEERGATQENENSPATEAQPRRSSGRKKADDEQPKQGRVNVMTAPAGVLQALPRISAGTVSHILKLRKQSGVKTQTIIASLKGFEDLVTAEPPGPAYQLRIDVVDDAIVPLAAVITVLLTSGGEQPYHILDWRAARPLPR